MCHSRFKVGEAGLAKTTSTALFFRSMPAASGTVSKAFCAPMDALTETVPLAVIEMVADRVPARPARPAATPDFFTSQDALRVSRDSFRAASFTLSSLGSSPPTHGMHACMHMCTCVCGCVCAACTCTLCMQAEPMDPWAHHICRAFPPMPCIPTHPPCIHLLALTIPPPRQVDSWHACTAPRLPGRLVEVPGSRP